MIRARRFVIFFAVAAFIAGGASTAFAGFFDDLKKAADSATNSISSTQEKPQAQPKETKRTSGGSILNLKEYYAGYSKDFQKVKKGIESGKVDKAYQSQQKKAKKEESNVLFSWEQSLMALDANKRAESIQHLEVSENLLKIRGKRSVADDTGTTALTEVVKFAGFDEFGEYEGEPFERILMLNFKSIAYMLNGDRKAYNVTRRSINWQNNEKKAFDKKMALVKKELKKEEKTQVKQNKQGGGGGNFNAISAIFKTSESKALEVPSAFVNPFGFYMAGVVQEYDSYQDASLRSNARISYQKALTLNPKSAVIKQALKSIKTKAPKGQRLIHIVVADGFAPEKKVARFDLPTPAGMIPIKIPIYVQDDSHVAKVEVQDSKGKCLATLSQVADIDAITMRHQYDSLPEQRLRLMLTVGRSVVESKVAESAGVFGLIAKAVRDETTNPDMRSWMGLPKQILAARLFLPPGSDNLQLVSLNAKGKVLTQKKLILQENDHNFVYARSFDKVLYINQSEKLWVKI